jgi:tetratricopeptide (TPR) repeat protein
MNLGISFFYQGRFDNSYDCYHDATIALERYGENSEAYHGYYNLAEVCIELGRQDEARRWYETGMRSISSSDYPQIYREFIALKPRMGG